MKGLILPRFFAGAATVVAAGLLLLGVTGCDELSARSGVRDANKLYAEGKYEDAIVIFHESLSIGVSAVTDRNAPRCLLGRVGGNPNDSPACYEETVARANDSGDPRQRGYVNLVLDDHGVPEVRTAAPGDAS